MRNRKPFPILLIVIIIALILLAAVAIIVVSRADLSRSKIPVLYQLPDFELTDQSGQPFGLSRMLGKISIVDFIFTNCKGPCPIMASKMSELYLLYKDYDHIQFVSISVDPERDTLEALREYAILQGVNDDRWVFLRGPLDDVVRLSEQGFKLAADVETLPMGHTIVWTLVDQDGRIRSYHNGTDDADIDVLKENIRRLNREIR